MNILNKNELKNIQAKMGLLPETVGECNTEIKEYCQYDQKRKIETLLINLRKHGKIPRWRLPKRFEK